VQAIAKAGDVYLDHFAPVGIRKRTARLNWDAARHVPAAMHGFVNLGGLIVPNAIKLARGVQVDMCQCQEGILKVVVARHAHRTQGRPVLRTVEAGSVAWQVPSAMAVCARLARLIATSAARLIEPVGALREVVMVLGATLVFV
jgi:hypothetical protein